MWVDLQTSGEHVFARVKFVMQINFLTICGTYNIKIVFLLFIKQGHNFCLCCVLLLGTCYAGGEDRYHSSLVLS